MRGIIVLAHFLAAVSAVPPGSQRIVGGSVTTINNYPTIAAVLMNRGGSNFAHNCGGTILNQRSILTAAHCFLNDNTALYRIRVGSSNANSGGVVHNVNRLTLHPNWNTFAFDNDIALVRTAGTINYSNVVQPASIAGANYNLGDNQVVWAAGWGATSHNGPWSEQLRHVQIWTINQNVCTQRYSNSVRITNNMLCSGWLDVGGRDQCSGDSGGPLYHNGVVVGVSSFGQRCGDPYYPGVNARISSFTSWIQSNA